MHCSNNPICAVGNSWMRAEIESNSTKMRKACVEVTQAFREFSPLLLEAIASLGQKTRFLPYPSYRFVPCRFLGRLRHIVESIRAAIVPPFLPPILISLTDRSTKTHWSIPSKVSQFNQLISMPQQLVLRHQFISSRWQQQKKMRKEVAIWQLRKRFERRLNV